MIVQVTITSYQMTATDHAARPPRAATLLREIAEGIAALASRRRCAAARRIHHSGISLGHLQILWILQEHGPLPVSRLADWLGIGVPERDRACSTGWSSAASSSASATPTTAGSSSPA